MNTILLPKPTNETLAQVTQTIVISEEQRLYKAKLLDKLGDFDDKEGFMSAIACHLREAYGIKDWALAPLGLPPKWCSRWSIGSIDMDYSTLYSENSFFNVDVILQHLNRSDAPVFFSDVEAGLKSLPFISDEHQAYMEIAKLNKKFGYLDSCNIPLRSQLDGSRIVLSLTSRGIDENKFKKNTKDHLRSLHTFGTAVVDTAITKHSDTFGLPFKEFKALSSDDGLTLIQKMVIDDLGVDECIKKLGLTTSTGKRKIAALKKMLNAKTNHGVIHKAIMEGLINIRHGTFDN